MILGYFYVAYEQFNIDFCVYNQNLVGKLRDFNQWFISQKRLNYFYDIESLRNVVHVEKITHKKL